MIHFLKAFFPEKLHRAITLFMVSLLLIVGVAACQDVAPSAKKLAVINADVIVPPKADADRTLDRVMAAKLLKVAVPDDFPPFGSVGPDMQLRGYDIDVAKAVSQVLGVELKLVPVVGNYRIPFLQTNRVDVVISSLGKNKDRAKIIDFSKPYAPFFSGVYGGSTVKVASMDDIKGHSIGVAQGSLEDLEISKLPAETMQVKRFASNSLTASALVSGQVELIATGNVVANKLIRDNPAQKIEKKIILKNSPCYIGLRKGDTRLLKRIDTIIADLEQSGKLNALSVEWLGEPLPKKFSA